jgi:hypothetical protein
VTAGLWERAAALGDRAGADRNRYVDFLRALSIMVVVVGHWLMAAPELLPDGTLQAGHVLSDLPWTQWLTWALQVMPVFFMVGGYANTLSWRLASRRRVRYGPWLHARLRRLVLPVIPLVAVWLGLAMVALPLGIDPALLKIGSQTALVPIWFLAVYVGVTALAPAMLAAWERWGWASFWVPGAAAVLADLAFLGAGWEAVGWLNYLFVWVAVHQLGIAWAHDRLGGPAHSLPWAVAGLAALLALVWVFEYPVSMVGVPGADVTNTTPPKVALLALGMLQTGVLLSIEAPARRWLERRRPWTFTVLVNGSIMTLYLWHLTAMVAVIGVLLAAGGVGLRFGAGSLAWWLTRPVWIVLMTLVTLPFLAVFSRFERPKGSPAAPSTPAAVAAVVLVCTGLALLAYFGIADESGLNLEGPVLLGAGVALGRVVGRPRRDADHASATPA